MPGVLENKLLRTRTSHTFLLASVSLCLGASWGDLTIVSETMRVRDSTVASEAAPENKVVPSAERHVLFHGDVRISHRNLLIHGVEADARYVRRHGSLEFISVTSCQASLAPRTLSGSAALCRYSPTPGLLRLHGSARVVTPAATIGGARIDISIPEGRILSIIP